MKSDQKSDSSMDRSRLLGPLTMIIALLLVLTLAYSLFVLISSQVVFALKTEDNSNSSILFNLIVEPHLLWIGLAWILCVFNTIYIYRVSKTDVSITTDTTHCIVANIIWILASILLHLTALLAPFVTYGYVIK